MGFKKGEVALSKTKDIESKEEPTIQDAIRSRAITLSTGTISVTDRGATENRKKLSELETLYRLDGLVFGMINKYVRDITGAGYTIVGKKSSNVNKVDDFCRDRGKGFNKSLRFAVRDSLIYGFAIFELIETRGGELTKIMRIDPKAVEFEKEGGKIKRDKYGYPMGFEYTDWQGLKAVLPKDK